MLASRLTHTHDLTTHVRLDWAKVYGTDVYDLCVCVCDLCVCVYDVYDVCEIGRASCRERV